MISTLKLLIPDICRKFRLLERAKVDSLKVRFSFQTTEAGRKLEGQLRELSGLPNMGSESIPALQNTTYDETVKDLVIFLVKK